MASLYEIDKNLESLIDYDTGEVADFEAFENLQMERAEKIENIALWYKNLISDAEQYKAEESAFAEKKRKAEKLAESLKNRLDMALSGEKFKTVRANITYRKSESVGIADINKIHSDYLNPYIPTANKTAIKTAIKAGLEVAGASIVEKQNIQIK